MYMEGNSFSYDRVDIGEVLNSLKELNIYKSTHPFIDQISIYFNGKDTMLSTLGKDNFERFFLDLLNYDRIDLEQWKQILKERNNHRILLPENVSMLSQPHRLLTYIQSLPPSDSRFAVTEHSNLYDEALDPQLSWKWRSVRESADNHTDAGSFIGIAGTETTWYNDIGHMNTFEIDFFINPHDTYYNDLTQYYDLIKRHPASINQWNHPWDHDFHAFLPYDKEVDQVIHLLEVPCIANPGVDSISYYIDALDKGWHVAPVGNQDNHIANWGTMNDNRTAILCERLTREHLFDAIRHYRVYSTSNPRLQIFYRINGAIMGSSLPAPAELDISIVVHDPVPDVIISRIEFITEQGEVAKSAPFNSNSVKWSFTFPNDRKYYWVKVTQADGNIAVTAPIWTHGR